MIRTTCEDCGTDIVSYAKHWEPALCYPCQQHRALMEKIYQDEAKKRLKVTGTYVGGLDRWE